MSYMLPGVRVRELRKIPDARGFFAELYREDWKNLLGEDRLVQANLSFSYPGIVRAWHRHVRGQVDYFIVLEGAMKICAYDDREDSQTKDHLVEIVLSSERLQVVRIPGHYWHGTMTIGNESSLTLYFVTKLYDYENPDEERRPWDDSTIIPRVINGKTDDFRCGKPWNWLYPPHK